VRGLEHCPVFDLAEQLHGHSARFLRRHRAMLSEGELNLPPARPCSQHIGFHPARMNEQAETFQFIVPNLLDRSLRLRGIDQTLRDLRHVIGPSCHRAYQHKGMISRHRL
jgi:hypothetical protein